jgi:polygalacturonase
MHQIHFRLLLSILFAGSASAASFDVRTSGAVADGKTTDTAACQKAQDDCANSGGGEVLVPAGDYLIGSIELKSNTTLRLDKAARLIGSPDLDDYPLTTGRWEGRWVDAHRALISAQDAKNIAVVGAGRIEGNPALGGRQMPRRPCVIEPINCTDDRLEDFTATQQRMWTIHPTYCQNVLAKNLTIRSTGGNSDGIDVDSCRFVRIANCDIDSGDDCIALKSGRGMEGFREAHPTENVMISDCTLGDSIFACIGIGSETSGGIRNVRIERCTFTHANTNAIYIKSRPGRGAYIDDISGNDLTVQSATRGFLRINLLSSGIQDPEPVPGDEGFVKASNFRFYNVKVSKCDILVDAASMPPDKPLDGLSLSDITGDCQRGLFLTNMKKVVLKNIEVTGFRGPLLRTMNVTGTGLEGAVPFVPTSAPTTAPSR